MMNPKLFSLCEILPINAIEIMKFNLNWTIHCHAISTQEQTHSLPGWPWFGTVSTVWGMSIFENEISASLAVGLNFWKSLTLKNCLWSLVSGEWSSLLPVAVDFLRKQQVAFAKADTGHSNNHAAGSQCSCSRLCITENRPHCSVAQSSVELQDRRVIKIVGIIYLMRTVQKISQVWI